MGKAKRRSLNQGINKQIRTQAIKEVREEKKATNKKPTKK